VALQIEIKRKPRTATSLGASLILDINWEPHIWYDKPYMWNLCTMMPEAVILCSILIHV